MVTEYLQCGKGIEYDIVQIFAALNLNEDSTSTTHGQMIAVIRFRISLFVNKKDPLILSFVLGDDISLRSILGLPTFLSMGVTLNLPLGKLVRSELNFNLNYF